MKEQILCSFKILLSLFGVSMILTHSTCTYTVRYLTSMCCVFSNVASVFFFHTNATCSP